MQNVRTGLQIGDSISPKWVITAAKCSCLMLVWKGRSVHCQLLSFFEWVLDQAGDGTWHSSLPANMAALRLTQVSLTTGNTEANNFLAVPSRTPTPETTRTLSACTHLPATRGGHYWTTGRITSCGTKWLPWEAAGFARSRDHVRIHLARLQVIHSLQR